ncbi:hypothetical protein [uncultured Maricaulis sp.]|uniref:DUF6950 family protein n=1 Tax=uncultured Maricaulis sp. TaxID=174710 RepID=UPI0030DB8710|tara:strand:- start:125545 stop:125976 length:432 start_codon:yes stop_codon:yes gene_type:complete
MSQAVTRFHAAQAAIDVFAGRQLAWGKHDCVRLVRFTMHHLGVGLPMLKGVRYRTEDGAIRAMKKLGLSGLDAGVDRAGLPRIAPARALLCDIVALPADDPFKAALMVNVGNGRLLGVVPGERRFAILQPAEYLAAWSVLGHG